MKVWGIKIWVITTTSFSRLIGLNRCTVPWSNLQERPTEFFSNLVLFKSVVKVKVVILMFFYRLKFSLGGTPVYYRIFTQNVNKRTKTDVCIRHPTTPKYFGFFLSFLWNILSSSIFHDCEFYCGHYKITQFSKNRTTIISLLFLFYADVKVQISRNQTKSVKSAAVCRLSIPMRQKKKKKSCMQTFNFNQAYVAFSLLWNISNTLMYIL